MLEVRRLKAVGTLMSLAVILTCAYVWGDPRRDKDLKDWRDNAKAAEKIDRDEGAVNRFADQPLNLYQTTSGDLLFALQVKPELQPVPPRPRDVLVLIDTSASKAMGPLAQAIKITEALLAKLGPKDRVAVHTANLSSKKLSKGFLPVDKLDAALKELHKEYPSGAVNLKQALKDALASFPVDAGRQQLILFLGDGKSLAGPLDGADRARLCTELVQRQIAFFTVPLGDNLDPLNLHGLVNGTGGKLVRLNLRQGLEAVVARLLESFAEPILYPTKVQLPEVVLESFPSPLPPLRRDSATLVVGKLNKPGARFEYSVSGNVAGQDVTLKLGHAVPEADVDNFFLVGIVKQWRDHKDRPALLQADRALVQAFERNQLARADLLAKAEWAIDENKFDAASKLFKQAEELDPNSKEARAGQDLVQKLRDGLINREGLKRQFDRKKDDLVVRVQGGKVVNGPREEPVAQADKDAGKDGQPPPNPENPPAQGDILRNAKALQAVADQLAAQLTDEAIRRANRMVQTSPDDAHDFLKRTLDSVRNNPDVSERVRVSLGERVERSLQGVDRLGARIKRDQAQNMELQALADARRTRENADKAGEDRIRERLRVFHTLMNQARQDLAYKQASDIRTDQIVQGKEVPQAVIAAYKSGLVGYHDKELREMQRDREERFLSVLLQVDKSRTPFPDEPGIEFPTPTIIRSLTRDRFDNWTDFSKFRIERYAVTSFGAALPKRALELRDQLGKTVTFKEPIEDPKTTLADVIDLLHVRYNLPISVNEKAFKFDNVMDVMKTEIALTPLNLGTTTLNSALKKILARIPATSGATYLIRREEIEITTGMFALGEKTVRTYPVADLVTPVASPGSFNQQNAINQGVIIGGFGIAGGALGALGALGGQLGALGALGGQLGALGALGGQLGALGALGGQLGALGGQLGALGGQLGALGGQLGALGGQLGALGGQLGALGGQLGFGGQLGALGGQLGFGGQIGQLGQLGQIGQRGFSGGQNFQGGLGLQNNNQSQVLVTLIRQVVGQPKDWLPQFDPITGKPIQQLDEGAPGGMDMSVPGADNNNLGFYPPANALVVKATSRIHSAVTSPLFSNVPGMMPGGMGALDKPNNGEKLVKLGPRNDPGGIKIAGNGDERPDLKKTKDPKKIWQDALAQGVDNPGLIIACADYLALNLKWDHAAEFLKANLREGIVVKPWVYEALAVALRESGGSAEEIERAEVALADLSPLDANGFLKASQAMANNKHFDRAVAFCQQASQLEPNLARPYAEALLYAEQGQDSKAMAWAAGNLLRQDWPYNNKELQARARQKLDNLVRTLEKSNRKEEGARLLEAVQGQRQRDLVIKMSFQGEADLDLRVKEPSGSVCSPLNRQTVGGGILIGDTLSDMTSETYLAARAFSGEYQISVDRVWGKPLGNRAQIKVIYHQGTPQEREELLTVDLQAKTTLKIRLEEGRRTETAYVPPPAAVQASDGPTALTPDKPDRVMNQLRALADPEVTGFERGFRGATSSPGVSTPWSRAVKAPESKSGDVTLMQNRLSSFVKNSLDVTVQAVLSSDRQTVRVSMTPVFNTVGVGSGKPVVNNPGIPGGP